MTKYPSARGAAIEAAFAERFARHREPVQYLASLRTAGGTVFACERVTEGHINLWLPECSAAKAALEKAGLPIDRSLPWPANHSCNYGRISSLSSISEMRDEPLYRVKVTTVGEALHVVGALV